jgi:hypothetical protein
MKAVRSSETSAGFTKLRGITTQKIEFFEMREDYITLTTQYKQKIEDISKMCNSRHLIKPTRRLLEQPG